MADLTSMSLEQLQKYAAQLQAEVNKAHAPKELTLKVSTKGAVSIYGLGRWPLTIYRSGAERIFTPEFCARVQAFIKANESKLSVKPGADATTEQGESVAK